MFHMLRFGWPEQFTLAFVKLPDRRRDSLGTETIRRAEGGVGVPFCRRRGGQKNARTWNY
jgi:hypothetical protein